MAEMRGEYDEGGSEEDGGGDIISDHKGDYGGSSSIFGQGPFGQLSASQSTVTVQPAPVSYPYGTLPAMPQMSIGRVGASPSVQYGISSMPVIVDTSFLTLAIDRKKIQDPSCDPTRFDKWGLRFLMDFF